MMDFHPIANIFPMMPEAELATLAEDIAKNGLLEPIVTYEGQVLDGRNRYVACFMNEIEPTYVEYTGEDPLGYVISLNLHRRHLSSSQKAAIAIEAEAIIEKLEADAKARQATSTGGADPQLIQMFEKAGPHNTADTVAELFDTNRQYYQDAKRIKQDAPELLEQVRSGEMSIPQAKREISRRDVIEQLNDTKAQQVKETAGVFDVIVIDPPWQMKKIERDVAPTQVEFEYPTMTIEEIAGLKIPCADDCHVWLWTTHKYLPRAFELLDKWGLNYICTFVWHKPGGFQPFGLPQYNCEFALYARYGTPSFVDLKQLKLCFDAPRTGHSKKPDVFYDLVRRITAGRRLDMFNRRTIAGFETWGQEAK